MVSGRSIRPPSYPFVSDLKNEAMAVTKIDKKGQVWHLPEFYRSGTAMGRKSPGVTRYSPGSLRKRIIRSVLAPSCCCTRQGESVNILLNFTQFFETRIEYRFQ
ncbi:hypothetical protein, partial [Aeromonas hydrophila]